MMSDGWWTRCGPVRTHYRELFDADVHRHAPESRRGEMRVEGEGVSDTLGPHDRKARGVHDTEIMVAVSIEESRCATCQVLADEEPLETRRRVERLQKPPTGIVASRHAPQRVGPADYMVRRDQYDGTRDQSSTRARGILVPPLGVRS
jgi:hypothetical protein